LIIKLGKQ